MENKSIVMIQWVSENWIFAHSSTREKLSELTLSLSLCRLEWERCTIFCRKYYQECISSLVRRTSWWKIQCFTKLNNSFDAKEERLHILFIYILLFLLYQCWSGYPRPKSLTARLARAHLVGYCHGTKVIILIRSLATTS